MRTSVACGIFVLALTAVPFLVRADSSCPVFSGTLSLGSSGADVSALQTFLVNQGNLPSDDVTGYFGALTEAAVRAWQVQNQIVSADADVNEGAGIVGPKTRAAIGNECSPTSSSGSWATNGPPAPQAASASVASSPPPPAAVTSTDGTSAASGKCVAAPYPQSSCLTDWLGKLGSGGCVKSWICITPAISPNLSSLGQSSAIISASATSSGEEAPIILSINGPSTITSGTSGSWGVSAIDPQNGQLFYSFSWGDASIGEIAGGAQGFTAASIASHTYSSSGSYSIVITVGDSSGNTTTASFRVSVSPASVAPPPQGQPQGSYGGGVLGQPCFDPGAESFTACPAMADCTQGGTYLVCQNNVWSPL